VASRSNHPSVRIIPANTAGTDDCSLSVSIDRIVEGGMITSCQRLATPPEKNIKKNNATPLQYLVKYCKKGT